MTSNLINATGRALTNTAVYGGSLEDALKQALIGAFVDTAHGEVASLIKGLESDYVAHKLAHALAGCAAGAAAGGSCRDGAIGAAVGEIVAQLMPPANLIAYSDSEKANVLLLSKVVAGAAAAYAGGNAQTAITTADTAVKNNALVPLILGALWLIDKGITLYQASQDIAAIRDGTKTVQQVAIERGEEYVVRVLLSNVAVYGWKAIKVGGTWVQSKAANYVYNLESRGAKIGATEGLGAVREVGNGVRVYPDGSLRTPDGKFASVSGNLAPGTAASANYADFLSKNGVNVVGKEMEVQGPLGIRRYDIVVKDAEGKLQGIEIKSGSATKDTYQDFTDRFVNQFGAQGVGKLKGQTITSTITIYVP